MAGQSLQPLTCQLVVEVDIQSMFMGFTCEAMPANFRSMDVAKPLLFVAKVVRDR